MQDHTISWTELFAAAEAWIASELFSARDEGRPLLLQPSTRAGSLGLLAVGLLWPHDVILDEKNLLVSTDAVVLDERTIQAELLPKTPFIAGGEAMAVERFANWSLVLCTSGSTGEPKRIRKSGAGLLAEVRDLAAIYRWDAGSVILSLVSPLHIYGLLHSFLLPLFCGASVEFVSFQEGPVDPKDLRHDAYAGVIAVPATWSFVKDLLQNKRLGAVVMSGAPFGDRRRQELQTGAKKPQQALEILGSTETGGLGYRSLLGDEDAFEPLPSVRILDDRVESLYLKPETTVALADRLEMQADGRFLHRGRMDRIFKYAGQRYALGEVEKALSLALQDVATWVRFHGDEQVAQGGWLEAWIETSTPLDRAALRAVYQTLTRAPFPQVLHCLPVFPRDGQGKVQLALMGRGPGAD